MLETLPLHPQMQALADAMAAAPPLSTLTPVAAREAMGALDAMLGVGPPIARAETLAMAGPGGEIALRLLSPENPRGLILYFHGGGWVLGTLSQVEAVGRMLAIASGCAVLLVDYRLAPEHPYPAAIEDSRAALDWCDAHMTELLGRRVPLVLAGDSAGGNLATLLAGWATDRGRPGIAGQFFAYPVTDADLDTESYRRFANGPILDRETMAWFWGHYLADAQARFDPAVSPLRRRALNGMPPAIIVTAGHDPLLSEGEAYVRALEGAGVTVVSRHYADMAHGFVTMPEIIDAGADALSFAGAEIARLVSAYSDTRQIATV